MATNLDPGTGETPLANDYFANLDKTAKQTAGGSDTYQQLYAFLDFKNVFGRNPTASELSMLSPNYAGNKNVTNNANGKSIVSQYYQSIAKSPDNLATRERERLEKEAPEHYGSVDETFQSTLGRNATDEEKSHFGSLLASKQLDTYQLGQFIGELPESVKKQDAEFRTKLSGELDTQNQKYFSDKILPSIQQRFQAQGRSVDSSGYAAALALAAEDQSANRENFLTNLSANQYGNQTANARADYQTTLDRYYQSKDYSTDRSNYLADQLQGRATEFGNYNLQKSAYDEYLSRYGKRGGSPMAGIGAGAATGATIGAGFGGIGAPIGAVIGAGVGAFAGR